MRGRRGREDARRGPGLTDVTPAASSVAAIVAAAGRGERSGAGIPKQFREIAGDPMIARSVKPLLDSGCAPVVIAAPTDHLDVTRSLFDATPEVEIVPGGPTRSASVAAALDRVRTDHVLVHDAARPLVPPGLIHAVLDALGHADAVIPVIPVDETLKRVDEGVVAETVDRSALWTVQTPQGFRTEVLRRAYSEGGSRGATDDAALVERIGGRVETVRGSRRNLKVTTEEDLELADELARASFEDAVIRVGHGFDAHAFEEGGRLVIGGVDVPHTRGLAGHSDADVLSHAVADAILGAAGLGDLGAMFPAVDRWRNASSLDILRSAAGAARDRGWLAANVDATVIAEEPRLAPFKEQMSASIAEAIGIHAEAVSVKATTTDGLGSTGRGEGVAAHAVVLLRRLR